MERRPEITYLLLLCLSTAGALTVTMAPSPVTALRGQDVTITCHVTELNVSKPVELIWTRNLGSRNKDIYEYLNGKVKLSTPRYHVNEDEIQRGNAALHISGVQFEDEGKYNCYIINSPDERDGSSTLQVSALPSVKLAPHLHIEPGYEISAVCEVTGFYPQAITINWVRHHKHSPGYEILKKGKFTTDPEINTDETFNITSQLILRPQIEDDGTQYSCIVTHRSLEEEIVRNFTLTVSERDNTRTIIGAVIGTVVCALVIVAAVYYFLMIKPYRPTVWNITGNDPLINMIRMTLICPIMNYRPNDITISVCLRRSGEQETIIIINNWKSRDYSAEDGAVVLNVGDQEQLMNVNQSHEDRLLQLEMVPLFSKTRLGLSSCWCLLHITPNYDTDNGAELSVHVKHPAMTSPVSVRRILNMAGVAPKLMKITTPEHIQHGEEVTLTCPIIGFKPRALSITWLRKERDGRESELVTWNPERQDTRMERYSHNLKEEELDDKSHSFLSALTLRATIMEDDGVTYICKTFHPATGKTSEKELIMTVTGGPERPDAAAAPPSSRDPTNQRGEARAQNRED